MSKPTYQSFRPVGTFQFMEDIIVHFDKKIGEEIHTEIFEGYSRKKGEKIAVKCIDLVTNPKFKPIVEKEIKILHGNMDNPNICKLIDYTMTKKTAYLITEVVKGQDLEKYMKSKGMIHEDEAVKYANHIICGMKALTNFDLLHGNLTPSNLVLHEDLDGLTLKFPNFLFSAQLEELNAQKIEIPKKTFLYMAPEVLQNLKYHEKSEIWSLGIIFYEMLYGCKPWQGKTADEHLKFIYNQELDFPDTNKVSDTALQFIQDCLNRTPELRPGWRDLISHRLIFRSLFMQSDRTYTLYNAKFDEHSPTKANLKYGIRKEGTVTTQSYLNLSSTLNLSKFPDSPKKSMQSISSKALESLKTSDLSILNAKSPAKSNNTSLNFSSYISKLSTTDKKTETSRQFTYSKSSVLLNTSKIVPKHSFYDKASKKSTERSTPSIFYTPVTERKNHFQPNFFTESYPEAQRSVAEFNNLLKQCEAISNEKVKKAFLMILFREIKGLEGSNMIAEYRKILKAVDQKINEKNHDNINMDYVKLFDMIIKLSNSKESKIVKDLIHLLLSLREKSTLFKKIPFGLRNNRITESLNHGDFDKIREILS